MIQIARDLPSPHLHRVTGTVKYSSDELTSSSGHERTTGYERETEQSPSPHPPNHHHLSGTDKATGPGHSWSTAVCVCPRVCLCVSVRSNSTVRVFLDEQGDVAVSPGSL